MSTTFSTSQGKRSAYASLLETLIPAISAAGEETGLYQTVVDALHQLPTYDWTGIYVLASPGTLTLGPYRGAPTDHLEIPVGRGICGQSAERDATVVVEDVTREANYLACSLETRAEIVVPIRVDGAYHAQIDVDSHTPGAFDAADREALESVALAMGQRLRELR